MEQLRYQVFLNEAATIPVATFIIEAYAQSFVTPRFDEVDLWVIRDQRDGDRIVARNPRPTQPYHSRTSEPELPPLPLSTERRRSSDR